jgi:hypothetical protein
MVSSDWGIRPRTIAYRKMPTVRRQRMGTGSGRAAFVALGPSAWYDAKDFTTVTQQTLTNRIGSGTLQFGSVGTSDANDPTGIIYDGTQDLYGGGGAAATGFNYINSSTTSIAGKTSLLVTVTLRVRTLGANQDIGGNWLSTVGTSSYLVGISNTNKPYLKFTDGTTYFVSSGSTAATTAAVGDLLTLTFSLASSGAVTYTEQVNGGTPATLSTVATAAWTAFHDNSARSTAVGNYQASTSGGWTGQIRSFEVWDANTGGTKVVDFQPAVYNTAESTSTWVDGRGVTWTHQRATSGLTIHPVTRNVIELDGADDYLQHPAGDTPTLTATTGAHTVMLINRVYNLAGAATKSRVWSSESASDNGAYIYLDNANAQYKVTVGGATTTATTAAAVFTQRTQLHAVAAVFDTGTAYAYTTTTGRTAGTAYTGVGTVTHTTPRVGSRADSVASPADFLCYAVVTWTRALNPAELASAATYLLGSYT